MPSGGKGRHALTAAFLGRLRDAVQAEAKAQKDMLAAQWARPLNERIGEGLALGPLRVEGVDTLPSRTA